ncbi:MAG: excinuclease ABC subunit UvrB [Pseudomonadota bacterium]
MNEKFQLVSDFKPTGDQPQAIEKLVDNFEHGDMQQVLLGVTGSGKTFTIANVVERMGCPTIVIAHNKTLAAQLFQEFKALFPGSAVEYFVSYYDYYQPEAYIPSTDTYIEKDSSINDEIDRMRHSATRSILTRPDTIVVASVSCIYGIGSAESYARMLVTVEEGKNISRDDFLTRLVEIQYDRNDYDFYRGSFRVRGDVIEVFPPQEDDMAVRIELWDDLVTKISVVDPLKGQTREVLEKAVFYPGSHYVTPRDTLVRAIETIKQELDQRLMELDAASKLVEKQRLRERTLFDIEMLETTGYCTGIENYSRHLSGRQSGEPPPTLLNYFPDNFLVVIDESHQTIPQIQAMFKGDRSRKQTLVEFGFRLPSALDNRPLTFEEFNERIKRTLFVSATPADYEIKKAEGRIAEQIIRPTGLLDPQIEIKKASGQVDDLVETIRERVDNGQRVLACTLTKRMAEDLTEYLTGLGIKAGYLHADIDTLERVDILRDLRTGTYDVLVGINLLREGRALPEGSLVAILDADREGFLRSGRSLIQMFGRSARHIDGKVILYADTETDSIKTAVAETTRRRKIQTKYNKKHNITPQTIQKAIRDLRPGSPTSDYLDLAPGDDTGELDEMEAAELGQKIDVLRARMLRAAENLDFERAAQLRDLVQSLSGKMAGDEASIAGPGPVRKTRGGRKRPRRKVRR